MNDIDKYPTPVGKAIADAEDFIRSVVVDAPDPTMPDMISNHPETIPEGHSRTMLPGVVMQTETWESLQEGGK